MMFNGWIYFCGTVALFIGFIVAIVYYYNPKRKAKVEEAKYRMMEDDDQIKPGSDKKNDDRKDT